jgi:uncharacterized protein (DUF2147 family)
MNAIKLKTALRGIFFLFISIGLNTVQAQGKKDAIIGVWETKNKDGKMEIFKNGDEYQAKLLWGKDIINADGSSKIDVNNTVTKLQNRKLVGIIYLEGLKFKDDKWEKGRVYNSANGKWYKCFVWLENDQLFLRGYLGLKVLGQTSTWNRIKKTKNN